MVSEKVYINGLSVIAPGLVEHDDVLAVLLGEKKWCPEPLPNLVPSLLPANERRRSTTLIKLALKTIQPLLKSDDDLTLTATVFASSDGDLDIDDKICRALGKEEKIVSPTQFHNSVHNAAAGYWAIAASMRATSVSLSAGDGTFAAGLIDALTQSLSEQQNVLFVAYDVVAPEPLNTVRHFDYPVGIALRLGTTREDSCLGMIQVSLNDIKTNITHCKNDSLEPLRNGNPIGAGIPLLEVLAMNSSESVILPYIMGKHLQVNISNVE